MSTRSLASGYYRPLAGIESSSAHDRWYMVAIDPAGTLSCDCSAWTTNAANLERRAVKRGGIVIEPAVYRDGPRRCKHTEPIAIIMQGTQLAGWTQVPIGSPPPLSPWHQSLVDAIRESFRGLHGDWWVQERDSRIGSDRYKFILIRLRTGNGRAAAGVVALALDHLHQEGSHDQQVAYIREQVSAWIGYTLMASIARQEGWTQLGQPPARYRHEGTARRRPAPTPAASPPPAQRPARPTPPPPLPALTDVLRIGQRRDLGDGLTPQQRAENMLRLFLGADYQRLEAQGFLDVSSTVVPGRVYRVRRDPDKCEARRVRVFERGRYVADYCIVPDMSGFPEADHWLTVFMGLMTDERQACAVVNGATWHIGARPGDGNNVFSPYSDCSDDEETIPAIWHQRPNQIVRGG